MRPDKFISQSQETDLIYKLGDRLLKEGFNAANSVIVTVSTDYSSIVGQILRHQLSYEGEICEGFGIDVPYPDEQWGETYTNAMIQTFKLFAPLYQFKNLILVEAGVIRGGQLFLHS